MNKSTYRTESKGTGKFWLFDNGQFAEKVEYMAQEQYQLAYHYGLVYVHHFTINDNGVITNSWQAPLSSINNESVRKICEDLFLNDKKKGIVSSDYKFK